MKKVVDCPCINSTGDYCYDYVLSKKWDLWLCTT